MDTLHQLNQRIKENQAVIAQEAAFTKKEIRLDESALFFIPGFEKVLLMIYIIFLPYLAGMMFLFFYVAKANISVFMSLSSESSFIFSWCIGYECLATLALAMIVRSAIKYNLALYRLEDRKSIFIRPV